MTALVGLPAVASLAQASDAKTGTSGAQFLKIGAGARPTAMGDAYTAIADDVNAVYFNPAGLTQLPAAQITAMQTQWFEGLDYAFGAFALPTVAWRVRLVRRDARSERSRAARRSTNPRWATSTTRIRPTRFPTALRSTIASRWALPPA